MKKISFKNILDLILSVVLGLYINLYITSDIVALFFLGKYRMYVIVSYIVLILQILLIFSIIKLFRNKQIDKTTYYVLIALYISMMVSLLFRGTPMNYEVNLNPLTLLKNLNEADRLIQNIFNIICFMPVGYFIKNLTFIKSFIISISGIFAIELIQLISRRGVFDINDIILSMIGIYIIYFVSNKHSNSNKHSDYTINP